jgi:hypothetical protein
MKLTGAFHIYAKTSKNCMSFWLKVCWKRVQGNATYSPPYGTDQSPLASQMAHPEFKTMIKYLPAAGSCLWQLTQLKPCRRVTRKLVSALPCVVDGSRVSSFSYMTSCTCVCQLVWLTYRFEFRDSLMQDVWVSSYK